MYNDRTTAALCGGRWNVDKGPRDLTLLYSALATVGSILGAGHIRGTWSQRKAREVVYGRLLGFWKFLGDLAVFYLFMQW